MSDNRMNYSIDKQMQFPLVDIELEPGEKVFIQRGSMVYHSTSIKLNTKVNGTGSGIGKLIRAVAPALRGEVLPLKLGKEQYRINDGKFLAMDGSASYSMKKQSVGRAIFSGTGGFFVMTTSGEENYTK